MKTKITITILIIVLSVLVGYIIFEKSVGYLQGERLLYYERGTNEGISYWNNQVIQTANSEGKIPFIVNNSVQTISIEQLCEK